MTMGGSGITQRKLYTRIHKVAAVQYDGSRGMRDYYGMKSIIFPDEYGPEYKIRSGNHWLPVGNGDWLVWSIDGLEVVSNTKFLRDYNVIDTGEPEYNASWEDF